jgi:hypothetical protein
MKAAPSPLPSPRGRGSHAPDSAPLGVPVQLSTFGMFASSFAIRSVPLGCVDRKLKPPWFFEAAAIFFHSDTEAFGS